MAALRALRLWSGLTYRQLEGKASASGDVLPSSTIASALGRSTMPREQMVTALVRACGVGETAVQEWLAARERIVMGEPEAKESPTGPTPPPEPSPRRREPSRAILVVATVVATATLSIGGYILFSDLVGRPTREHAPPSGTGLPIRGLTMGMAGSWVAIRAATAPDLCVSEGRDSTGRYSHPVAALRPCEQAVPPRTYLRPIKAHLVQIQWHEASEGIGCLTVRTDGAGRDLVEPWNDCDENRSSQVFRMALAGPPDSRRYRIHPTHSDMCLGIGNKEVVADREAVHGPCTGLADQEFVIDLLPPP
ncbi:helix-turn-helix transcriptional regulator [Kibdelosporangium persicum]